MASKLDYPSVKSETKTKKKTSGGSTKMKSKTKSEVKTKGETAKMETYSEGNTAQGARTRARFTIEREDGSSEIWEGDAREGMKRKK